MNELRVFEHEYFGEIRVIGSGEQQYFVGKDIAIALGYSNASKAIITHVDDDDKIFIMVDTKSQNGNVSKTKTACINESGMYALILGSKLPSAKKFKQWVTSEVLPSIRKRGAYMNTETANKMLSDPIFAKELLTSLVAEQDAHKETKMILYNTQNELIDTKDEIDQFLNTENIIEMETVAKNLGYGKVKLYRWLRENKILKIGEYECGGKIYKTEENNMPYKKYEKYFKVKYRVYNTGRHPILCMTAEGQMWLYNVLVKEGLVKRNLTIERAC